MKIKCRCQTQTNYFVICIFDTLYFKINVVKISDQQQIWGYEKGR
jgi:hypothetical protein